MLCPKHKMFVGVTVTVNPFAGWVIVNVPVMVHAFASVTVTFKFLLIY